MKWRLHLIIPLKKNFGIIKKCWGITLIAITAKVYNALLLNLILPKMEEIHRKNQNGFRRNWSTGSDSDYPQNHWRSTYKKATLQFIDSSEAFDSIHRGMIDQMLLGHGLPRKKNYYGNDALQNHENNGFLTWWRYRRFLPGDTLAPFLFIICLDYVLRTSIDLIKKNSR